VRAARRLFLVAFASCANAPPPESPPPLEREPADQTRPSEPVDPAPAPPEPAPADAPVDEPPVEPSAPRAPEPKAPPSAENTPSAAETSACRARGGTMKPVCMMGTVTCVVRYRDGGKRCTDASECEGNCVYEGEDPPPPDPNGNCQRTSDPCGCWSLMMNGRVQPALCVD
jgi:hypothetical protein